MFTGTINVYKIEINNEILDCAPCSHFIVVAI